MTRLPLLFAVAVAATTPLAAQTPVAALVDSARISIDRAVAAEDTLALAQADAMLARALTQSPGDAYALHYRGYLAYERALLQLPNADTKAVSASLASAIEQLTASSSALPWPETFALLASAYGLTILQNPSRAMDLGPQVGELQARALALGPSNPRVHLIVGTALANTPPEWGGGLPQAKAMLERAVALFATDRPSALLPAWGRAEAQRQLTALGGKAP